ncbi:rCG59557, partial [Rattus norvegicus]
MSPFSLVQQSSNPVSSVLVVFCFIACRSTYGMSFQAPLPVLKSVLQCCTNTDIKALLVFICILGDFPRLPFFESFLLRWVNFLTSSFARFWNCIRFSHLHWSWVSSRGF